MKLFKTFLVLFFSAFIFTSCDKIEQKDSYRISIPIVEKMATIRTEPIAVTQPQPLKESGKIYIYNDFLFISEPMNGVHIYNNVDPSNPIPVSFINIPGNVDMAIKDNVLYADSYVDLLVFDLSNPSKPVLVNRNEDVFKGLYIYDNNNNTNAFVVTAYKDSLVTYEDRNKYKPSVQYSMNEGSFSGVGGSYGQGGSMARFTLANNHLYTVDNSKLHLFNVSDSKRPSFVKDISLGWGIETIFPYKNKLFIGSNSGMYIYDISEPSAPEQLSVYSHVRACDPVVVNDDYAFVTLRTGAMCAGVVNVLEVVDIKDPTQPKLVKSYPMKNPHGLALSGDWLYLCEGDYGFKSFEVKDVQNIGKEVEYLRNMKSTDVIPGPKSMIIIGEDGVCQYDYSNKGKLKLLSCISFIPA